MALDVQDFVPKEQRELVFQFFVAFMRFEYALKRAGFVSSANGKVSANWDRFASKYSTRFTPTASPELREACNYFKMYPPRKQVLNAGALDWSEPSQSLSDQPFLIWLLLSVRMVRNNLFHGGKFPIAPIAEPARNPLLLRHSLTILDACLLLDAEVKRYFVTIDN
jgi:hypothetical protein